MTVKEIIITYLKENGYNGLCNVDAECGCSLKDFTPCHPEDCFADCEPALLYRENP